MQNQEENQSQGEETYNEKSFRELHTKVEAIGTEQKQLLTIFSKHSFCCWSCQQLQRNLYSVCKMWNH